MIYKPYKKITGKLRENKIKFSEIEHEPVFTSEQAAKVRNAPMNCGIKSLILKTKKGFVLAILPGDKKIDSKKFKKLPGIKDFRFATPEEVNKTVGCEIGSCYPFGSIPNIPIYADISLDKCIEIYFNPGLHDKTIEMHWTDLKRIEKPNMVEIT